MFLRQMSRSPCDLVRDLNIQAYRPPIIPLQRMVSITFLAYAECDLTNTFAIALSKFLDLSEFLENR
jgi:hypothetical protein